MAALDDSDVEQGLPRPTRFSTLGTTREIFDPSNEQQRLSIDTAKDNESGEAVSDHHIIQGGEHGASHTGLASVQVCVAPDM